MVLESDEEALVWSLRGVGEELKQSWHGADKLHAEVAKARWGKCGSPMGKVWKRRKGRLGLCAQNAASFVSFST